MRQRRESNKASLWRNYRLLAKINRPQVAFVPIAGIPERPDRKHEQQAILATEGFFHDPVHHDAIQMEIQSKCGFGEAWNYQRLFFSDLMSRFFPEAGDRPAWISIIPRRVTMQFRQARGFVLSQSVAGPLSQAPARKLWDHRLSLGSVKIPCEGLILVPKNGRPIRETHLVYQAIFRDMEEQAGNRVFCTVEHWCYLATPGDPEDFSDAKAARVPALRQFYDEERHVQKAALVNFCKLSGCGRWVDQFSVNLHPVEGKALDLRACLVPFEYYLRSDANNHAMLWRAVTRECMSKF